jgi:hypothetical protein
LNEIGEAHPSIPVQGTLLKLVDEVKNQTGNHLRRGYAYNINEVTAENLLGPEYASTLTRLHRYIKQGIDPQNPKVLTLVFLESALEVMQEWQDLRKNALLKGERNRTRQAKFDIHKLIDYFKPIKTGKEYAITPDKLNVLLEAKRPEEVMYRLESLFKLQYLKSEPAPHEGQYGLEFLAKAIELAKEAEQPTRKVHRQLSVDVNGVQEQLDLRSLIGKVLGKADTTLRQCQTWLSELENPELPTTQRVRVQIYLGRAEALWSPEMEHLDAPLHYRILQRLGKPERSSLWPLINSDLYDMEGEAEKAVVLGGLLRVVDSSSRMGLSHPLPQIPLYSNPPQIDKGAPGPAGGVHNEA